MEPITKPVKRVVADQLGRTPRGNFDVATCCVHNYPQVIRVYPVLDGKPFPTLFWLTCPYLVREISTLESTGWIRRLETDIQHTPHLESELAAAHRTYIATRDSLLTDEDRSLLASGAMMDSLSEKGIGGIEDFQTIKCLHLHVAHELAAANPIGKIALSKLTRLNCPTSAEFCN